MTKSTIFRRNRDSFFTYFFARSISKKFTPIIATTNATPLQITMLSLLAGILAAIFGSFSFIFSGIIAAILLEVSHVLDCIDGELARLTGRGSPFAASMDPISDRFKDCAIIIAAFKQSLFHLTPPFSTITLSVLSLIVISLWLIYMYIVDGYLNPAKKSYQKEEINNGKLYIGLYDFFIYGCILFLIVNIFHYFLFYLFFISSIAIIIQLIKLYKIYKHI